MAEVIRGPAGGSHRTTAVIVILTALILLTLAWVMTQGRNNKVSDRVGTPTTAPATGTASGVTSGQEGGNQSTDEGQPVTGH